MPAVRLLAPLDGSPTNSIFATDNVYAQILVNTGKASYDLTGGFKWPMERAAAFLSADNTPVKSDRPLCWKAPRPLLYWPPNHVNPRKGTGNIHG